MINRNWQNEDEEVEEKVDKVETEEKHWSLQFALTENLRHDAKRIAEAKGIAGLCVIKTRIIKGRYPPMEVDVEASPRPTEYMRRLVTETITPEQQEQIRQEYGL